MSFDRSCVNRFLFDKQHLSDHTKSDDLLVVVRDIFGLHATFPTTPYISLFIRMGRFEKAGLDAELYVKKSLSRIRCVRKTMYIHPLDMLSTIFAGTKDIVRPASDNFYRYMGVDMETYERISKEVYDVLAGKGMTVAEINRAIGRQQSISPIVNLMCDAGTLVRGRTKGWSSSIYTYHILSEYLPGVSLDFADGKEARRTVVEEYVKAFGPVTENDVTWWTGFTKRAVREALSDLDAGLVPVEIKGHDGERFIVKGDLERMRRSDDGKGGYNALLPCLDPYVMGYRDRDRYVDPGHFHDVFDRSGNATYTIWADGSIAGIWDIEKGDKPSIKLHFFNSPDKRNVNDIRLKAANMGRFIVGNDVKIKIVKKMAPLDTMSVGSFISPLKGL